MPYFKTAQEWTRITTRYSIKPAPPPKNKDSSSSIAAAEPKPPRGVLVIKTYDPESGVVLKYRTTKAAEVSRLIQSSLGRLGRGMAAVPEPPAEEAMPDAPGAGAAVEGDAAKAAAPPAQGQPASGGGGGGKKKKKGKK
ncbi:hypothetical protein ACRE_050560 [Hapsidospora chrysogenum ATCC 11550]|uniref:SRP9 domain-containing protein n=1 Tax=Hapsidospora chrysogenum (strain ATCC 11550 / CBS 779.69 / DSM 880 / IAM 14645 / JCM 23072 / IMI 49137) TaxID=857340 RepID=A0A086T488_HAPC1|nr:hypothetical protein ACRE_050560 [Hapsidospora chrysogenum ATCC 11550]